VLRRLEAIAYLTVTRTATVLKFKT
jgi:hypothetical protein